MHTDLAGPFQALKRGSHYLIIFADSGSRWMRPYGIRSKSETTA